MEYCKIVIAEDELLMRQGIKNIVRWESEGFKIVGEAANGEEALELVARLRPHIVVTDIVMPVMDGIELTAALAARFPEVKVVILSSYSDFNYVKSTLQSGAADYLLKPTLSPETLLETMKASAAKIPFRLRPETDGDPTVEMLLSNAASGFARQNELQRLSEMFGKSEFLLCSVSGGAEVFTSLKRLCDELLSEFTAAVFGLDGGAFLLVNYSAGLLPHVLKEVETLANRLHERLHHGVFVAAGPAFGELCGLHAATAATLAAAEKRFYYPRRCFYAETKIPAPPERFNLQRFSSYLSMSQLWNAMDMFASFVVKSLAEKQMSKREIKAFVQSTLFQVFTALRELRLSEANLENLKRSYFSTIDKAETSDELLELVCIILEDYLQIESKYRPTAQSETIVKIVDYINEHYAEPLTLSDLAERFSFNYNYLSTYFSTHSSEGFSEYLNRLRIARACELLSSGDLAISEICGEVGYTDHSYFTKVFKKITGKTPREYRQQSSRG